MTSRDTSPNAFERGKPGTSARDRAEGRIEGVRDLGGVFVEAVRATRLPMVLTDPTLPGDPIVFANQAFLDLSGYSMAEVLGQSPHFMNGPDTDPEDAARFVQILADDQDGVVETIQYAKDGRRFVATVLLSAFKDDAGQAINHFLTWADVTRRVDAEDAARKLGEAEGALRENERRLAAELSGSRLLQQLSTRLIPERSPEALYEQILDTAQKLMEADAVSIQLLDEDGKRLRRVATRNLYRLAPESPYPARLDDALAVYQALERERPAEYIGVYGTSAGAVLSAQLVARLASLKRSAPGVLGFFSGTADAARKGDSESWVPAPTGVLAPEADYGVSLTDPVLSPIYGDLSRFPPTLLVTSTRDLALSGTSNFGRALLEEGVDARLVVFDGLPHAFWAYMPDIPETAQANHLMARFLAKHLQSKAQRRLAGSVPHVRVRK